MRVEESIERRGRHERSELRTRVVDDLVSRLRSCGQSHVVTLRNADLFPTDTWATYGRRYTNL